MKEKKVSILMLNYNGEKILNVIKESIRYLKASTYDNFELLFVDNGSKDNSFEAISKYMEEIKFDKVIKIESKVNLGFTGGNNLAYRNRDQKSEYILLLNSDTVTKPEALRYLVRKMEEEPQVGAATGVVLKYGSELIQATGYLMDEFYTAIPLFWNERYDENVNYSPFLQTYPLGACVIIRQKAIEEINGNGTIFDEDFFMYGDDALLGINLWNHNYQVKSYPFIAAEHVGGASGKTLLQLYYQLLGKVAMPEILPNRWKRYYDAYVKKVFINDLLIFPKQAGLFLDALRQGKKIGERLRSKYQFSLYKAPIIMLNQKMILKRLLGRSRHANEEAQGLARNWVKSKF